MLTVSCTFIITFLYLYLICICANTHVHILVSLVSLVLVSLTGGQAKLVQANSKQLYRVQGKSSVHPSVTLRYCDHIQCESKNPSIKFSDIFSKQLGTFSPNFTHLLDIPIYARVQIFYSIICNLMKLCQIKRDHPVHTICSKCPPSAKMHAGWSHSIWHDFVTVGHN